MTRPAKSIVRRARSNNAEPVGSRARPFGLRLLVVCHTHPRFSRGGAEIAAYETFRRATAQPGVEAWFFASNGQAHGAKIGVGVQQPFGPKEFVHTGGSYEQFKLSNPDPAFEREFGRVLREVRPDVVHFHHYLGVGVEAFLYVRRYAPQARVILTLHEYLIICHHHGQMVTRPDLDLCEAASPQRCGRCFPERTPQSFFLRRLWLQRFLREVDIFVAPSKFLKGRYEAWGIAPEKIVVLENLLPRTESIGDLKSIQPNSSTKLRVGFFGQLSQLKGIDVVLRAAAILQERKACVSFELHGSFESTPADFRERVRVTLASLPGNVVFRGRYENARVQELMRLVDVVVVPSIWWENAPLVIDEAQAAGRIVVGSEIGGIAEKLVKIPGSRLFPPADSIALADVLSDLATHRSHKDADDQSIRPIDDTAALESLMVLYAESIACVT